LPTPVSQEQRKAFEEKGFIVIDISTKFSADRPQLVLPPLMHNGIIQQTQHGIDLRFPRIFHNKTVLVVQVLAFVDEHGRRYEPYKSGRIRFVERRNVARRSIPNSNEFRVVCDASVEINHLLRQI
jgi:hypothetical protein